MMKSILKKTLPFWVLAIICIVGILMINDNKAVADSNSYTLTVVGIAGDQNGKTIDLSTNISTEVIIGGDTAAITEITDVEWISSNKEVATVEKVSGNPKRATITRENIGFATITGIITTVNNTYTTSFVVKYDFELNATLFTGIGMSEKKFIIFNINDIRNRGDILTGTKRNNLLKYKGTSTPVLKPLVTWGYEKSNIVEIDDVGTLSCIGSGLEKVTLKSITSNGTAFLSGSFEVLAQPGLSKNMSDPFSNRITINGNYNPFELYTNAVHSDLLNWVIYNKNGKVTSIDIAEIRASSFGEKCEILLKKAGTYSVYALVVKENEFDRSATTDVKQALAEITVPMSIKSEPVVMNVGDTYNIYENSNAPLGTLNIDDENGVTVVAINQSTGIVTATEKGEEIVTIGLNAGNTDIQVLTPAAITFTVIDAIALTTTDASIYKGSSMVLDAIVTDSTYPITWTSADKAIATVVGDGKTATVTGVKVGNTKITASQTIKGVKKTATCYITVKDGVTKITLDPDEKTLNLDEYLTILATITPSTAKDTEIRWVSSNDKIVKIEDEDVKGRTITIKAMSGGVAVISAIDKYNVIVGSAKITVKQKVMGITLSETSITTDLATRRLQLRATVTPDNALDQSIKWSSSDTKVATVNQNGLVSLVTSGKVTILATSVDNPAVQALCNIVINVPVASFKLDSTTMTVGVGKTERITYYVYPINATTNSISWTSTDTSIATVDGSGSVTGKSIGQTTIIARSTDGGIVQYCTVKVTSDPTGLKLDKTKLILKKGEYYYLIPTLTPPNASNSTIRWESSNTKVATVTQAGKVDAKSGGSAVIMAKNANGDTVLCNVDVIDMVTGIKLNYAKKTVSKGKSFTLVAKVEPDTASNQSVIWESSDTKVVTVSKNGSIKGIKGGVAVITCKTVDGGHVATCVVTIKELVTKIKLNKTSYKLGLSKSYTLKATVSASSASNKGVTWKSSNTKVATVDSRGKITGKRLGYATITATAKDGSRVEKTCEIRVVRSVSSIKLNKSAITVVEGRSYKLKVTIKPSNATYKTAKWTSSDTSVAVVSSDGKITALKPGSTIITAKAKDSTGKSASCFVNVIKSVPTTSVTILNTNSIMVVGETAVFQNTTSPATSTDSSAWFSDNTTIASISKTTGKVTAKKPGIANITVTSGSKTSTVKVTVVGLDRTSLVLEQYDADYKLNVEGISSGITWIIADTSVAIVTNSGIVKARKPGRTIITATVNGKKLNCKLTVTEIK